MLCAVVAVAAALGCETTRPPEVQDTAIVTAGHSFQLTSGPRPGAYNATIPHSFTNRTGSKVYIDVGCNGGRHIDFEMDEDGSGEWVRFYSQDYCLVEFPFTAIEPGEVYQGTLHVEAGVCTPGLSCLTLPAASTRFRIVWWVFSSVDRDQYGDPIPGDPIPLEERVSNHFTFEVVEASH
ncbi:MAG: hypothetical protein J4F34_04725 [Gemmatimonadetes bacterium]|nr:hypothetical protein [Gemmatimonadota bacterium]